MTLTVEIPEELAPRLGEAAGTLSREALAIEALRRGLWTESDVAVFLGLGRMALDEFLKVHGVELEYEWSDLEAERAVHRTLAAQ